MLAFNEEVEVVGECGDGFEAIAKTKELCPDCVLMDLNMPNCTGLEALYAIKKDMPEVKVIILTISDDDIDVFTAIKYGAEGYLLKDMEPYELFEMFKRVRMGEPAIKGKIAAKILKEFREPTSTTEELPGADHALTSRETKVLELIVKGATNSEIAEALYISENTVKLHLRSILTKLHLKNRVQAAVYAVRQGLVSE